ncbi:CUED1-like protein [Mya arenaria]|uniref:CUED1-like protein n=1 Tax=Mya arenaria TaxID=6604 RepID=A0ABY7E1Y9_MYAAR|nr:CUED1-like protein [Mya arenaria]
MPKARYNIYQAMDDFRTMFPTLDDEVIEAVLRANDGAVDATIDQLLTMTIDEDTGLATVPDDSGHARALFKEHEDHMDTSLLAAAAAPLTQSADSPPSYSEAIRSPGTRDGPQSIWTTPISSSQPPINRNQLRLDVDSRSEHFGATSGLSPSGLAARHNTSPGFGFSPSQESSGAFGVHISSTGDIQNLNTSRKREFRNWNPPMLGNLPEDFLRLIPPDTSRAGSSCAKSEQMDNMASLTSTPVNVKSMSDARPKIHKSRSKSEKVSRSFSLSTKDGKDKDAAKSRSSEKKSKSSDKFTRSFSLVEETPKSSGARHKDKGLSPGKHSVIIETHDFSKGMLEERIKENERRRKKTSANIDPELAQSNTPTGDRTISAVPNFTPLTSDRPPDNALQGYGDNGDQTLDAFPFSQPSAKDKDADAELRQQIRGMGKKDEDEEEEEDVQPDTRYGSSPPVIDPLPSLASVPSHRTVQRPAYNPNGVTTYFDNRNMDMV